MSFKKGVVYVFIANVLNLIISLFTGFVLPKLLSIDTYANIKLFQLYITYIGILHLGFADGMYLRIGGKNIDSIDKKEIRAEFKTFKIFQLVVSILAIIFSLLIKNEMLLFCSMVILPINVGNYLRQVYQATGQFKKYSRFTNINTVLIFIVNLILLFIVKTDDYSKYIIAYIIAYIIYWIMIEFETRKILGKEKVKADKRYLIKDVKDGFFLMIGNFCNVIFTGIDRLFVQNLMGSVKFAFYSFAVSVENLMNVFITPISTVMYNYLCNNNEREKVLKIKDIIVVFSAIIISIIFPAKFIVENWLQKYSESINVLFILIAAQCITIMVRCIHVNLYKAKKKQNRYFAIMTIIIVISVILNVIFYFSFRTMEAIAFATLCTSIIWFIIGEIDFKEYRMSIKNYVYIFIAVILFLTCGQITNTIMGTIIYVSMVLVLTLMLKRNTFEYMLKEGVGFLKKKFLNK